MRQIFSILAFILLAASVFAQSPNTPPILFSSRFQITNAVNGTGDTIVISGYTDDCTTRFSNSDIAIGDSLYVLEGTDLLIFGVVTTRTISLGIATFKVRDFNGAGLLPSNGQAAIFRPTTDYDFPGYVCGLNDGLQQYISDRFRQNLDAALSAGSTDSTIYATVYSRDTAAAAIRGEIGLKVSQVEWLARQKFEAYQVNPPVSRVVGDTTFERLLDAKYLYVPGTDEERIYFLSAAPGYGYRYVSSFDHGKTWSWGTYQPAFFTPLGSGDETSLHECFILPLDSLNWRMYYQAIDGAGVIRTKLATSTDAGVTWTRQGVVLDVGTTGEWDELYAGCRNLFIDDDSSYYMIYEGYSTTVPNLSAGVATSADGLTWTKQGMVMTPDSLNYPWEFPAGFDGWGNGYTGQKIGDVYVIMYGTLSPGISDLTVPFTGRAIGLAFSTDGINYTRYSGNPVIQLDTFASQTPGDWNHGTEDFTFWGKIPGQEGAYNIITRARKLYTGGAVGWNFGLYRLGNRLDIADIIGASYNSGSDLLTLQRRSITDITLSIPTDTLPASVIPFTPTGDIAATNVQTALAELDTEKQKLIQFQDEGSNQGTAGQATILNVVGGSASVGLSGSTATLTVSPASSQGHVWFVRPNGVNATAVEGDFFKPALTPYYVAKNLAHRGDVINVEKGTYVMGVDPVYSSDFAANTLAFKDSLTYVATPATIFSAPSLTTTAHLIFTDYKTGAATTSPRVFSMTGKPSIVATGSGGTIKAIGAMYNSASTFNCDLKTVSFLGGGRNWGFQMAMNNLNMNIEKIEVSGGITFSIASVNDSIAVTQAVGRNYNVNINNSISNGVGDPYGAIRFETGDSIGTYLINVNNVTLQGTRHGFLKIGSNVKKTSVKMNFGTILQTTAATKLNAYAANAASANSDLNFVGETTAKGSLYEINISNVVSPNALWGGFSNDSLTMDSSVIILNIKKGIWTRSAPFLIERMILRNNSKIIINCDDCRTSGAQSMFWISNCYTDATSSIEIKGNYRVSGANAVLNTRNEIILNNATLINDGTVAAIQSDAATNVIIKSAFTNAVADDSDITYTVLPPVKNTAIK